MELYSNHSQPTLQQSNILSKQDGSVNILSFQHGRSILSLQYVSVQWSQPALQQCNILSPHHDRLNILILFLGSESIFFLRTVGSVNILRPQHSSATFSVHSIYQRKVIGPQYGSVNVTSPQNVSVTFLM